jgi:enterochelin esterase-like enzyme
VIVTHGAEQSARRLSLLAAMSVVVVSGCVPAPEAVPVVSTPIVSTPPVVSETTSTTLADPNRQTPGLFYSPRVGDHFQIYVHVPDDYETDTNVNYPVVYILDGDWYFDGTNARLPGGIVRIVSSLVYTGDMPPAILVGIGYPGATGRGRDFVETPRAFHAFLVGDLIPTIDERFRTVPTGRTLIGHSGGAYSAVHALLRFMDSDVPPFTKYIAISGNYNNGTLIWDTEERLSRRVETGDVPVALYLAVGEMDEPWFVRSGRRLADVLAERDYENLDLKMRIYDTAGHSDLVHQAFTDGLKWQFASPHE